MKPTESFQNNIILVCLFIWTIVLCVPSIEGSPRCNIEEYWLKLFGKCMPCSQICHPLGRSDCTRNCPDYILKLSCPIDSYWSTLYAECVLCITVCSPQNRTICQSNCGRYIDSLMVENTTTDTIPLPTTTIPLTISNWAEEHMIYIVSASFLLLLFGVCIALYVCWQKVVQYLQCGRNGNTNTKTVQPQETDIESSSSLLVVGECSHDPPS